MATPKSKKRTTGEQPSPPLDDKRWLTLTMAHHTRSEQLGKQVLAPCEQPFDGSVKERKAALQA